MDELAKVAEALGDPLRMRILDLLASGRLNACCSPTNPEAPAAVCACDIATDLGGLAPSKLAYHLARLRAAGLVQEQRRGKWVYYSINRETLAGLCRQLLSRWTGDSACCRTPAAPSPERPGSAPARPRQRAHAPARRRIR
jgi:ArsR family transcriptional regulator, arsenate/arsenite/antimonite-responsive transcriptional repressor